MICYATSSSHRLNRIMGSGYASGLSNTWVVEYSCRIVARLLCLTPADRGESLPVAVTFVAGAGILVGDDDDDVVDIHRADAGSISNCWWLIL